MPLGEFDVKATAKVVTLHHFGLEKFSFAQGIPKLFER